MAESLFTVQTPALPNEDDATDQTLGTVINPQVAGTVTHGRWFFPTSAPGGTVAFVLYDNDTHAELARANFSSPTLGAWNTVALGSPVSVVANQDLVAAIETPDKYVATGSFFTVDVNNGANLVGPASVNDPEGIGNGRFSGTVPDYPASTFSGNCYFADIVFEAATGEVANLGLVTETDMAQSMLVDVTADIGLVEETDTAQPLTALSEFNAGLGLVGETDTAQSMGAMFDQSATLGLITETDTALPMTATLTGAGIDTSVIPIATELLNCLCVEVSSVPKSPVICCLRTGTQVSANISVTDDECCRGMAWVRVVSIYPSEVNFPEADSEIRGNCPPQWLGVVLEMGVMRCAPAGTAYTYPSCNEWTEVSQNVMNDAQAMRRAFCCLDLDNAAKIMGPWEPIATEGACTGGTMTVTVQVPNCDGCEDM